MIRENGLGSHTEYQLQEKMGDGSWSNVRQTKEEAYPEEERTYSRFHTAEAAAEYVEESCRWAPNAIKRGAVRIIEVTVTRRLI